MSKKDIYAGSYTDEPKDNKKALETIQTHKMDMKRIQELGSMLKEERAKNQKLHSRINRLEEETRRLDAVLRKINR